MVECACGCGTTFEERDSRGRPRKYVHGHNNQGIKFPDRKPGHTEHQREILRERFTGENNPKWKGGRQSHGLGYVHILKPEHPNADNRGRILEHRLVMEKHLGRHLTADEVVHHINKNPSDNRVRNLKLFPNNGAHLKEELGGHR